MNKFVREQYPASRLPDDLREGIDPSREVTITVVVEEPPDRVMTFDEIVSLRKPPFLSKEEIDEHIRELREERDA
jgi:hypothetical protein